MSSDIITPQWISDDGQLRELCSRWEKLPVLAIDTEFIRVNTFYPQIGLLQVCDGEGSYLLDPLALEDWGAFRELLQAPEVLKVLHSCSEDLLVFKEYFDLIPGPIFDTQRAAAFLGMGYSISYQNLVSELLDIHVGKGETRSDWLRRPLSEEQKAYAALDVAYLPGMYAYLKEKLQERGQLEWLLAECEEMREIARQVEDEANWEDLYLSMGASWRLDRAQLAVLRRLSIWREQQARQQNRPRPWVARDADLILLAEEQPQSAAELRAMSGEKELSRDVLKQDPETLCRLIAEGREQSIPADAEAQGKPLSPDQRRRLKHCQAATKRVASETGIAVELLARKKQLIALLLAFDGPGVFEWPAELDGWRRALLEKPLLAALQPQEETAAGVDG